MPLIAVADVTKFFGGTPVLRGIDLDIDRARSSPWLRHRYCTGEINPLARPAAEHLACFVNHLSQ